MFLSEFFNQLTYGELAGLAIGGINDGGIQSVDYPKIINNINSGLIDLYTRLNLKNKELTLQLYDHITTYTLHNDYALSNGLSNQAYKYIIDSSSDPFKNDVLLVDSVFNEAGDEYPINEIKEKYSVFTPSYNTVQVPFAESSNALALIYRAAPDLIHTNITSPESTWIPLPYQLINCLIAYVLHKIHSSPPRDDKAGMYYNKYLNLVETVKNSGLLIKEHNLNEKLDQGGWV